MICFMPSFLSADPAQQSLEKAAEHIIYAGELIGYDHVGIGSDFDGMLDGPKGLEDTAMYPALVVELLKRGVCKEDVKKVVGLNIIRVLQGVEDAAKKIKEEEREWSPLMDEVKPVWENYEEIHELLRGRARLREKKLELEELQREVNGN